MHVVVIARQVAAAAATTAVAAAPIVTTAVTDAVRARFLHALSKTNLTSAIVSRKSSCDPPTGRRQ